MTISFPHPTIMYTVYESMWPRRAFGLSPDARATERIAMPAQSFEFDTQTGSVRDGGIRYLMMRPDVLMGVGTALGSIDQFVNALTESAFQNARASFEVYRRNGLLDFDGALQRAGEFAAWLGWGRWFVAYLENGNVVVLVRHSPFAYGLGRCDRPLCAPIVGVLRAVLLVSLEIGRASCRERGGQLV